MRTSSRGQCSGTSVQQPARSSRQQLTMCRQQPAATEASGPGDQRRVYGRAREVLGRLLVMSQKLLRHCSRLGHRAQIDFGKFRQGEYLRVPRRQHHHCRRRTFPLCGGVLQPNFIGKEASRIHDTSFQSTVKCDTLQSQGLKRQCRVVRRKASGPAHLKHDGEGVGVGSVNSFALSAELLSWLSRGEECCSACTLHSCTAHTCGQALVTVAPTHSRCPSRAVKQSCISHSLTLIPSS